jgi:hypothetical protein
MCANKLNICLAGLASLNGRARNLTYRSLGVWDKTVRQDELIAAFCMNGMIGGGLFFLRQPVAQSLQNRLSLRCLNEC